MLQAGLESLRLLLYHSTACSSVI